MRVPADVRLLELEIEVPVADDPTAKKPPRVKPKPKPVRCAVPAALRPGSFPEQRALLLAPGQSYIEMFDPRLLCFGKSADALRGGAVVRSRFGWKPPTTPRWVKKPKPPEGPFAAEGTDFPAVTAPVSQLSAPTLVLSYTPLRVPEAVAGPGTAGGAGARPAEAEASNPAGASGNQAAMAAPAAPPGGQYFVATHDVPPQSPPTGAQPAEQAPRIVDANAPRIELTTSPYADAAAARNLSITATATNAGRRPMLAVLRPRMLGFQIIGPDGESECSPFPPTHGIPREMFRTYKPNDATSFTVLLGEVCPRDAFARPGLYEVTATLYAGESGEEHGIQAYTGDITAKRPTLVRVQTGPEPFYRDSPRAIPTPKPPADDADSPATPE